MTPEAYKDLKKAKLSLEQGAKTFVVYKNTQLLFHSNKRGLTPYFDALEFNPDIFVDAVVGDRVIGRAAAYLYLNAQPLAVFGQLMTYDAIELLQSSTCIPSWTDSIPYLVDRESRAQDAIDECLANDMNPIKALQLIKDYLPADNL